MVYLFAKFYAAEWCANLFGKKKYHFLLKRKEGIIKLNFQGWKLGLHGRFVGLDFLVSHYFFMSTPIRLQLRCESTTDSVTFMSQCSRSEPKATHTENEEDDTLIRSYFNHDREYFLIYILMYKTNSSFNLLFWPRSRCNIITITTNFIPKWFLNTEFTYIYHSEDAQQNYDYPHQIAFT